MSKIIIHNESDLPDRVAVTMVSRVMADGFVSGEHQYCWASQFTDKVSGDIFGVVALKTRGKTHTFKVINTEADQ